MPDDIKSLLQQAPFSFVGTVLHLGAATTTQTAIDDHTAVVSVDQVLHAPDAFKHLDGHDITVQLSPTADVPTAGESLAFFVQGVSFGESIVVSEVGRLPVDSVMPHAQAAAEAAKPGGAFAGLARELDLEDLKAHMESADAVVIGRVTGLEKAHPDVRSEHDPHWWKATIEVQHVEKGDVSGPTVQVLYANSLDVRWRESPKPKAGQSGVWILHKSEAGLRDVAPFVIIDPKDVQPTQSLDALRAGGG